MSKHNLDLLIEAARLLKRPLGNWFLSEESRLTCSSPTKRQQTSAPPTMWMPSPRSARTPRTQIFRNDSANVVSLRTLVKELRFAWWRQKKTILDVMPLDEKILGFSNRWYKPALDSAVEHELGPDLRVRIVTGIYFCATKLEAFAGRGKGDY